MRSRNAKGPQWSLVRWLDNEMAELDGADGADVLAEGITGCGRSRSDQTG